jgi:hypothetical protein
MRSNHGNDNDNDNDNGDGGVTIVTRPITRRNRQYSELTLEEEGGGRARSSKENDARLVKPNTHVLLQPLAYVSCIMSHAFISCIIHI